MKKIIAWSLAAMIFLHLTGCYYDKEELAYPNNNPAGCDTANMKYSVEVTAILSGNTCFTCHSTANASSMGAGIRLDNYIAVRNLVDVNNVDGSRLVRAIEHTGPFPMPKGGSKMSDCNIQKIKAWVRRGAPN